MDKNIEKDQIKQRLFITLRIGTSNVKSNKSIKYIQTNNIEHERYHRYEIPINEVFISKYKYRALFPCLIPDGHTYAMLSDNYKRLTPEMPKYISLLQALEYLAFGWLPVDEQYAKLFGQKRYYETNPGGPDGKEQIKKLQEACEQLEVLLLWDLEYKVSEKDAQIANKFKEPKIVFSGSSTSVTLTDTKASKSFDNTTINFVDLSQCVKHLNNIKQNPIIFRLFLDGNKLKLQKNSEEPKTIHRFNTKFGSYDLMKYIIENEGKPVYLNDPKVKKLISGGTSNFETNLKRVFGGDNEQEIEWKEAIKRHFFPTFSTNIIMFNSIVNYAPELDK